MPTSAPSRAVPLLAVALLLWPGAVAAQGDAPPVPTTTPWSVDVQAGGWWRRDDAAAAGRESEVGGYFGAVRMRYLARPRLALVAGGGYGRRGDRWREIVTWPGGGETLRYHEDEVVLVTAGAEWQAVAGPTSLWLGLEGGLGWDRRPDTGRPGAPPSHPYPVVTSIEWRAYTPVVVPSVTVRHRVAPRLDVALSTRLPQGGRFAVAETPFVLAGLTWRP
jgi:hypothetical protein